MKQIKLKNVTKLTRKQVNDLKGELLASRLLVVQEREILGHDFCAIELQWKDIVVQAVSVIHWRDEHIKGRGRVIAKNRAYFRLAIAIGNRFGERAKMEIMGITDAKSEEGVLDIINLRGPTVWDV